MMRSLLDQKTKSKKGARKKAFIAIAIIHSKMLHTPIHYQPSIPASPGLNTKQSALPDHHTSYISNHLIRPDPFASYETSTSHSTSSIEDWVNKTLKDTSLFTLAKALERVPPFTQPSSPTTSLLGKRKRSLSPSSQQSEDAELLPLTRRLLRLHTKNMAGNNVYKTPTKGNAQGNAAAPPTPSSGSTVSNVNPKWVKMRMECHHIYRQSSAFDRADYNEFKKNVSSPIVADRPSGVKPGENSKFKEIYRTCVDNGATEATFKREML
uniref:Uncharacterized protein n=1 Tax=Cladonia uncialis subsp. uncialis TaxID=180999 RepID=A0A2K9YDX2_CLAUC|nr:hypothetical protein [Cladonia uncialis subsp. uncialis]